MKKNLILLLPVLLLLLPGASRAEVQVPESFKKLVPVYPGAELTFAIDTAKGSQVHFETTDSPSAVVAFFKKTLGGRGWKLSMEMAMPDGSSISYIKGKHSLTVIVSGEEGEKTCAIVNLATD